MLRWVSCIGNERNQLNVRELYLEKLPKKGTERATTKVEVTRIVLNIINTPCDLILAVGMSSSRLITIGVIVNAYFVIGVMT